MHHPPTPAHNTWWCCPSLPLCHVAARGEPPPGTTHWRTHTPSCPSNSRRAPACRPHACGAEDRSQTSWHGRCPLMKLTYGGGALRQRHVTLPEPTPGHDQLCAEVCRAHAGCCQDPERQRRCGWPQPSRNSGRPAPPHTHTRGTEHTVVCTPAAPPPHHYPWCRMAIGRRVTHLPMVVGCMLASGRI